MLNTQIERAGEPLELNWGWWHVERMMEVAILDHTGEDPESVELSPEFWTKVRDTDLHTKGEHTVVGEYHFRDESDGELLSILPGDILRMFR